MKQNIKKILIIIGSYIASMSVFLNMASPTDVEGVDVERLNDIFWNIQHSMENSRYISELVFFTVALISFWLLKKNYKPKKTIIIGALFVSLINLMGKSFEIGNTLELLYTNWGQLSKSMLVFIGYAYILILSASAFDHIVESYAEKKLIFNNNPEIIFGFRKTFVIYLIIYLIVVIIAFPGYMNNDTWDQAAQAIGTQSFSSHHPVFSTLLLKLMFTIATALGMPYLGLFFYGIMQALLLSAVLAYILSSMCKSGVNKYVCIAFFVFTLLSPYFLFFVGYLIKDMIYTYFFMLYFYELIVLIQAPEVFFSRKMHIILWSIGVIGVCLSRNNGTYTVIPASLVLVLYFLIYKKSFDKKKIVLAAALPIFIYFASMSIIMRIYNIEKGSFAEALSFPLQQTARVMLYHGDVIDSEEIEIIDRVVDAKSIAKLYDPMKSDAVKKTYKEPSFAELTDYFKLWIAQGLRYPMDYICATLNQSYPLLEIRDIRDYDIKTIRGSSYDREYDAIGIRPADGIFQPGKNTFRRLMLLKDSLPFFGILSSSGLSVLILIELTLLSFSRKRYKFLLAVLPLLMNIIIVVLAPIASVRYWYPIIYCSPMFILYYIFLSPKKSDSTKAKTEVQSGQLTD